MTKKIKVGMEPTNTIQFIDFAPTNRNTHYNEAVIYAKGVRGGKAKNACIIRMPHIIDDAVRSGYDKLRIAVNSLTNETFVVLDRNVGLQIFERKGAMRVTNTNFVKWLGERFDLPFNAGGIIVFSENLDRGSGYTYRIEAKQKQH